MHPYLSHLPPLKSAKLQLYFRRHHIEGGDQKEGEVVVGSVDSTVDSPPKCPPTMTMIELRARALTKSVKLRVVKS